MAILGCGKLKITKKEALIASFLFLNSILPDSNGYTLHALIFDFLLLTFDF
jgi:hypothetical protein